MKNRTILYIFLITAFFISQLHADELSDIELEITKVKNNIYMLEGVNGFAGGNIAVSAGEDGILIVDDQLPPMSKIIEQALSKIHPGSVRYILNTHWHRDHTGGNAHFSDHAVVIAHTNVRKRLMEEQKGFFGVTPAQPKQVWPIITFDQSITIHFNDETIKVLHYPNGHTDGDGIIIFVESNVAHLGDLLFTDMFPFVDLDSGGNVFNFIENIKEIMSILPKDVKIIPGHGSLTDMDGLKKHYGMLVETSNYVKNKVTQGVSLEKIKQEGLPKKWESFGQGFIKEKNWITFIYQSLQ